MTETLMFLFTIGFKNFSVATVECCWVLLVKVYTFLIFFFFFLDEMGLYLGRSPFLCQMPLIVISRDRKMQGHEPQVVCVCVCNFASLFALGPQFLRYREK